VQVVDVKHLFYRSEEAITISSVVAVELLRERRVENERYYKIHKHHLDKSEAVRREVPVRHPTLPQVIVSNHHDARKLMEMVYRTLGSMDVLS
jgi:hypothetical protein